MSAEKVEISKQPSPASDWFSDQPALLDTATTQSQVPKLVCCSISTYIT